jgi:hypothetical protein
MLFYVCEKPIEGGVDLEICSTCNIDEAEYWARLFCVPVEQVEAHNELEATTTFVENTTDGEGGVTQMNLFVGEL